MRRAALLLALLSTTALGGDDEIDELIRRLDHGVEVVRWDAADRLRRLGPAAEPAIPALIQAMKADSLWADDALVAIGAPAVPAIQELLAMPDRRADAIRALGKLGPAAADAATPIAKLLEDRDPEVRIAAAKALGRIGTRDAAEALKRALRDRSAQVRGCAAAGLFAIGAGSASSANVAVKALGTDPSYRLRNALVEIGDPIVEPLVRAYPSLRDGSKAHAIEVFEELAGRAKGALPLLIRVVAEDPTAGAALRRCAAEALAAIGLDDPACIPVLRVRRYDSACCEPVLEALATLGEPAVPTIADLLELGTEDMKEAAAGTLYEMGPVAAAARPQLRGCLDHPNRTIAVRVAFALLRIDPEDKEALAAIKRWMSVGEPDWRRPETRKFAAAGPTAIAALTDWLTDENERLREMAAIVFAIRPKEEPFPVGALVKALEDEEWRVRRWAAQALAHEAQEGRAALRGALGDPQRAVRMAAAESLAGIDGLTAGDAGVVLECLRHAEWDENGWAIRAAGRMAAKEAVPLLVELALGDDSGQAEEARKALVAIGKPAIPALVREMETWTLALIGEDSIPALVTASQGDDSFQRYWAVNLLADFHAHAERVVPALMRALDDKNAEVRAAAARGLGGLGPQAGEKSLAKLTAMFAVEPELFEQLARAIWAIAHDESILLPALRKRLEADSPAHRLDAIPVLSEMSVDSRQARALLLTLLEDTDPDVRVRAAYRVVSAVGRNDRAIAVLTLGLADENERDPCGFALRDTGDLARALIHAHPLVRAGAVEFMAECGIPGPTEARALLAALDSRDPVLRAGAAAALGHEASYADEAEPKLATLLRDRYIEVAVAAAKALAANGIRSADTLPKVYAAMGRKGMPIELAEALGPRGAEVVPELTRILKEGNEQQRVFAALALGHVGRAASPALDYLMELSEDESQPLRLRFAAGMAVRQIIDEIPFQAIGIGGRSGK